MRPDQAVPAGCVGARHWILPSLAHGLLLGHALPDPALLSFRAVVVYEAPILRHKHVSHRQILTCGPGRHPPSR